MTVTVYRFISREPVESDLVGQISTTLDDNGYTARVNSMEVSITHDGRLPKAVPDLLKAYGSRPEGK